MHIESTEILCRLTIYEQKSQKTHNLATRGPQSDPTPHATNSNGHFSTVSSWIGLKFVGDIQKGFKMYP